MADTRQARTGSGNRIAFGVLVVLVALFIFICDCGAFGGVGDMVSSVFVGFFGLADFAYSLVAVAVGVAVIFNFRVKARPAKILKLALMFLCGVWALNVYSSSAHFAASSGYGDYLVACYNGANTAGGMLFGIISYPLMRLITTVGALVVVCVAFFVLALIALFPTIKKDASYVSVPEAQQLPKRRRGSRIERQRAPTITDFSAGGGGNSLYVVDVEGDPLSRTARRNKGAAGYDPLYPNAGARYEDELRSDDRGRQRPDRFSSRSLARDILFNPDPDSDSYSAYRTMTNPDEALANPGAPYSAQRRGEMMRRLGVDDSSAMARDMVRERYFGERREEGEESDRSGASNIIDPDARGAAALGYNSFDALKADRTKQFGQMYSGMASSGTYGGANASARDDGARREVPKPSRQVRRASDAEDTQQGQTARSASDMAGLHGSVSRAITGEEKPSVPEAHAIPDAVGYEHEEKPRSAREAGFESAVAAAQRAIRENRAQGIVPGRPSAPTEEPKRKEVPRAFRGTAAEKKEDLPRPSAQEERTDKVFGGGYAPAERVTSAAESEKDRTSVPPQTAAPSAAGGNPFATSGASVSEEKQRRMEQAIAAGKPKEENVAFEGNGPVIQQSMFAKQQMENIAKARKEASPVASYEHIAEERSKRTYAPRDKGLQKAENLVKKVEKEKGERMTQVSIDQAISQATPKRPYVAPPLDLLLPAEREVDQDEDYEKKKAAICDKLRFFGVESEVTEIKVGPTFSLYTLHVEMPRGKSVNSLIAYEKDIAMAMEEKSVRILAPIPGQNAIGIEVPNKRRRIVRMRELMESSAFNSAKTPTTCAMGKDIYGTVYTSDIKDFPHLLVAGTTGSGKSIFLHTLIFSMIFRASPDEVRFILIDPKLMEFSHYEGLPHLMLNEIIFSADKAIRALNWAVKEMRRRIEYFAQLHFRDIDEYNRNCAQIGCEKMPRIIIIADEFADLMATGKKAVEEAVNALARLARAAGINLILATQRPSVDVVSGTIKNNLPTRVALTLSSLADSRTVMDAGGAEKLLGHGDLFYLTPKSSLPIRMQGALIEPSEMNAVVDFIKEHNDAVFDENLKNEISFEKQEENAHSDAAPKGKKNDGGLPPEVFKALRMGLDGSPITISGLQRKLGLGFPKAAKIVDIMSEHGFIAISDEDKKHRVCISEEEIDALENGGGEDDDGSEE